jgi:hypothetical protein
MPAIKAMDRISTKWQRVTSGAGLEYEEGVRNPAKNWAVETSAANAAYKAGMQASLSNDSFLKGVQKAGQTKWQTNAIAKGPIRFAQGVSLGIDAYSAGFSPYHNLIRSINLPARGAKGDPKNINRVAVLAAALHDLKVKGAK